MKTSNHFVVIFSTFILALSIAAGFGPVGLISLLILILAMFIYIHVTDEIRGYETRKEGNILIFKSDDKEIRVNLLKFQDWKDWNQDNIDNFESEKELCQLIEKPESLKWNKAKMESLLQEDDVHSVFLKVYK